MGCLADYRAGRQHRQKWLQKRLAVLTCNLPEQLQDLMLIGPCAGGTDCGPVTRRDMMELLPAAIVRSVIPVVPVLHVHVSVHGCMHVPVRFCMHGCLLFLFTFLFLFRVLFMFPIYGWLCACCCSFLYAFCLVYCICLCPSSCSGSLCLCLCSPSGQAAVLTSRQDLM